jgi:hypothetical protein
MFEDNEGDAEKNEEVDVQLNNTKAAPPFSSTQGLERAHINCSRLSNADYLLLKRRELNEVEESAEEK